MPAKDEKTEKNGSAELAQLQELYDLMVAEGLDTIELKDEEGRVRLSRVSSAPIVHLPIASARAAQPIASAPAAAASEAPASGQDTITAPLAGVFYRASSPTTAPFVKEGDTVDAGQTLCIVEAMKVMNEIKAERPCRIARIPAENSRPVTAGQTLFFIEPA